MTNFTKTLAAAALATGLIAGAAATASAAVPASLPATAPASLEFGNKTTETRQANPGAELAGYFYRYRCFYVRYGYRIYRRCYVRYYYY